MPQQLTRSAVRIYGALSALGSESGNLMEAILPFFDPVLRLYNGNKLDPNVIASAVRDTYKWNFNADLVEAFVPYLERQGWVVADIAANKDTSYTIQMPVQVNFDETAQNVESELRRIAIQFKSFSESLSPLTTIPRDVEEFEDILVEWLLYIEAFSERNIDFRAGFRKDETGTLRQYVEIPNTTSLRDEEKFLCARFVKRAIEEDKGSAEVLARIAAIGLLTEVVQDFVRPVTSVDRTDLIVYLDAPVAMELLGVSGRLARENTEPVIAELIRIGASIRIFGQSIEEIKNSLEAVLRNSRPTGPTAQAMLRREVLREYVMEVSRDPSSLLEKKGVKIAYRTMDQTPSEHQYFTKEQWEELYSKLSFAENPRAREHDADVTAFVVRQRHGRTSRDIFKSHAVLLTRNGLLAQIVRKISAQATAPAADAVPPVVHRRVLATAMWLRTGMGAGDLNIPKRMLLASCEHVLAIRPGVVDAVKRLTEALGDTDKTRQLDLLISQDRSAQALMDKTLGATNVVTEENFALLWQEMLHPHLEEERLKGQASLNEARAESKRRLEHANQKIEAIQREREQQEASLGAQLATKLQEDRDAVVALCADVERVLARKREIRIGLALVIALVSCIPMLLETTPIVRWLAVFFGFLFAFLTATGGRLLRVETGSEGALNELLKTAKHRRLVSKLEQFDVKWMGKKFVIDDQEKLPSAGNRNELFG
ncbi:hypothetical protein HHL25_22095 [Rhizobium sp. S-51]|uniref:Uncharacterized protein n=1 Tax=Rhizobium terricola TaxID=2728849 RepID=A0A7Y0B0D8_9HYPH|nr:hypothetical protein [Rhizobium terricola]NML76836.1 hypothetical protein [Rhizobium terricola]